MNRTKHEVLFFLVTIASHPFEVTNKATYHHTGNFSQNPIRFFVIIKILVIFVMF